MKPILLFFLLPIAVFSQKLSRPELIRCEATAKNVTIIRDNWGIPHVYGNTDADAVFGLMYAQCEDDFKRVEMNYIVKLGRLSELNGEQDLYNDLLIKMLIDSAEAVSDYNRAEPWMKQLLNAWADGINFYLYKNQQVTPAMITRFKPWYPLLWTDGSIGAINTADITTTDLKNFYSGEAPDHTMIETEIDQQTGSNGFALGPSKTASGSAILYINPHVTFYFRPEVQVVSHQGLNAYGAVTWGQFFVYQGFNEHCGWMHTSNNVDVADTYLEKVSEKNGKMNYEYEGAQKPVTEKMIALRYLEAGTLKTKNIKAYYTHHGPVMAVRNGKWISLRSYNRSIISLAQSWKRTKANGFEDYKKVMDMLGNTSNNTVYADDKGNIAYWHGNFIPARDPSYDWSKPVDGTIAGTEWKGLHRVAQTVHLYNPVNGWLQNCNSTPFTVAGNNSPLRGNYPHYMAPDGENFRGVNAVRLLSKGHNYTIDKIIADGYDTYLSAFEILLPALVNSFDMSLKPTDSLYAPLKDMMDVLRTWDYRSSAGSIATTLAVEWAYAVSPAIQKVYISQDENDQVERTRQFAASASAAALLQPLLQVKIDLVKRFGKWQMPWGEVNRFQRIANEAQDRFEDAQPSMPVGFTSALWGQLPSYNSKYYPNTNKRYGVSGNSFICAVEFGKRIKARSLLAGGESGDPTSKHFSDQAEMYTQGRFKEVLFYKEDVLKHIERKYHPGG
ncbi:MAG: penicillin acylase family protein [Chitinophagaceae bacterium]